MTIGRSFEVKSSSSFLEILANPLAISISLTIKAKGLVGRFLRSLNLTIASGLLASQTK